MCRVGSFHTCGRGEAFIFTIAKAFLSSCSITLNVYSESIRIKTGTGQSGLTSSPREGRAELHMGWTLGCLWKNCGISWAVSSCLHGTAVCYEASCDWGMQQEDESGRKVLQHLVQDRHIVSEHGSAAFPAFSPMVCSVSSLAPTLIINWGLVSHFCSCKCHCSCLHPWVCMLRMTQQGHSGNLLQILTRFVHVSRYISRG